MGRHLHHALNPEAAIDAVDAHDGAGGLPANAAHQPDVVGGEDDQARRHQRQVQSCLLHTALCDGRDEEDGDRDGHGAPLLCIR